MGATLGHLIILTLNITRKQMIGGHSSIDFAVSDPFLKANKICPLNELFQFTKWDKKDDIVRIVCIPLAMDPVGGRLNTITGEIIHRELVSVAFQHNDLVHGLKITNFTYDKHVYELTQFKELVIDFTDHSDHKKCKQYNS